MTLSLGAANVPFLRAVGSSKQIRVLLSPVNSHGSGRQRGAPWEGKMDMQPRQIGDPCVYIIECVYENGTHVKIGTTTGDPRKRMSRLQTGNPTALRLVGVIEGWGMSEERELHRIFDARRCKGEWFCSGGSVLLLSLLVGAHGTLKGGCKHVSTCCVHCLMDEASKLALSLIDYAKEAPNGVTSAVD